jgi:adenylate kinase family enzyme
MKKISIIGSGGAGKSTFARELARRTGIPVYHLDALYWKPGWVKTKSAEWRSMQEALCGEEHWILDGNYRATFDIRFQHSDTIIFLDINRFRCLARALWRSIKSYGRRRPDMAPGCKERLDLSFVRWIIDYPTTQRPDLLKQLSALQPEKDIILLKSPRAVREFLQRV